MPNQRRRAKKARKRAENGQLIPGVPAFHQGTAPEPGQEQRLHDSFFGAHEHGPPPLPPVPGINATFQEVVDWGRAVSEDGSVDVTASVDIWKRLQVGGVGGVGGGGGGPSFSVSDIGPVREAVELASQQLIRENARLDRELQQAQLDLERQIREGQLDLANRTETRIGRIQAMQNMLRQLELQVNSQLTLRGFDVQLRGQDIQQQGDVIDAEQRRFASEIEFWKARMDDALARGKLELAQEAQENLQRIQQAQLELTGRGQDVTARGQDVNAQIQANDQELRDAISQRDFAIANGDLAARQDAERRIRASEAAGIQLDAQAAQLDAARFEQTGVQGATTALGTIGRDLGNIELQRDRFLSQLLANPRDAPQLDIALGGGVQKLLQGQAPGGQSIGNIGTTPLLGDLFARTLQQINQRPDLDFFNRAGEFAEQLGTTQAPQTISPQDLVGQFRDELPPLAPLPAPPAPFTPTPVDVAPVAPFVPPVQEPITIGTPTPILGPASPELVGTAETTLADFQAGQAAGEAETGVTQQGFSAIELLQRLMSDPDFAARQRGELPIPAPPELPAPIPGLAGGGDLVIDEPTVAIGMRTGRPKFTLGEPTRQFPSGIPERVKITPMFAHGGQVSTKPTPAPEIGQPIGPPLRQFNPSPNPAPVSDLDIQLVDRNNPIPRTRPDVSPFGGVFRQAPAPIGQPIAPQPTSSFTRPTRIARPRTSGEILLGIRNALTPRSFLNLLPGQLDFLGGRVSALGISENDFFTDLRRGFPTGVNPAAISRASFSGGGTVYNLPRSQFRVVA